MPGFEAAVSDFAFIVPVAIKEFFCPWRNQSPPHERQLADRLLGILADDRDGLGQGDVEAWRPVLLPIGSLEVFLDDLLSPRQSVATAHGLRLWQIRVG
jgi:hypothetical protein